MKFIEKRLFLKSSLIFCLIHVLLYVPMHLTYTGVLDGLPPTLIVIIGAFTSAFSELASFGLPLFAAAIIFISYAYRGPLHALPRVFLFSLPYLLSTVPTNYLYYLAAFDSSGALFFSVLYSVLVMLIVTVQILVLFGVICFFFRFPKEGRFEKKALMPLEEENSFDFSKPLAKGFFAAAFVQFLITFIPSVVDTVSYIIDKKGTYRFNELITIVLTFLFITLELVLAYTAVYKMKNKLIYERLLDDAK